MCRENIRDKSDLQMCMNNFHSNQFRKASLLRDYSAETGEGLTKHFVDADLGNIRKRSSRFSSGDSN